ncbi:MAG: CoA pyrophosphatase [Dehalococcoidales bacterium]|nr:CoA pyrophosphatase [Dehalococcoidales bacterium]
MQSKLKQFLSTREKQYITGSGRIPAAVILPLYVKRGRYHILFIKRTDKVTRHKGEISFPGGVHEKRDKTLRDTALRECTEEIGLLARDVEILSELDDEVSVATNYVISPFAALIPWPYHFKVDGRETEAIIEVPVSALLKSGRSRQEIRDSKTITVYFYHHQGQVIWGATARILKKFLDIFNRVGQDI